MHVEASFNPKVSLKNLFVQHWKKNLVFLLEEAWEKDSRCNVRSITNKLKNPALSGFLVVCEPGVRSLLVAFLDIIEVIWHDHFVSNILVRFITSCRVVMLIKPFF